MNSLTAPWIATAALSGVLLFTSGCKSCGCGAMMSHGSTQAAVKPYPLTTCIVTDEKLGSKGEPVVFVHKGQEIKLCCKDCRKDFDADPAKYLSKLSGAAPKGDDAHAAHH